ncbi:hypothetical protein M378DRAFT_190043 [Amanita muscaria Koide BX008]|uniref:Phospholipid scramblase n=1 Tax=Amanita muscaria (strain Koide BX008) TaxID=946122 RepID=A0A0C2T1F6_AMAMK|nr:hypothetical protein M378DRAFT_190043 [Amanita muscaria Koide BX008]
MFLPLNTSLRTFATSSRAYALSRFTNRATGTSRKRTIPSKRAPDLERSQDIPYEEEASEDVSRLWHTSQRPPSSDPEEGLRTLLMHHKTLVIERQIEMLNIFVGFEQCNKYTIRMNFLSIMSRQVFATHRPFRAIIMDAAGSPVLWLRRPFAWINSRMYVQRLQDLKSYTGEGEPILDTFGEVQQIWHPWRRRYDVFLREEPRRVLSLAHETQPEPAPELTYTQLAKVDTWPLAWHFPLYDNSGSEIAFISREFRGFGREIFTDTGQYTVSFVPQESYSEVGYDPSKRAPPRNLSIDERAIVLALAVNIDFDYFSRHSRVGGVRILQL